MKRRTKAILLVVILLIPLLIPIHVYYKDGGSHEWRAILWQVTRLHKMEDAGYRVGTRITLFLGSVTVFDNSRVVPWEE